VDLRTAPRFTWTKWFWEFQASCQRSVFYLGENVFHLSRDVIQSFMYLKLFVVGYLTIFITCSRGPFWSHRSAPIPLAAVFGTQAIATLTAVYGIFATPIGWGWALTVWGYGLAWFLVNDSIKLAAYRIFHFGPWPLPKKHSSAFFQAQSA
jgi:H+-transporting ATPase